MATLFRPPIALRVWQRRATLDVQDAVRPNLLTTTLSRPVSFIGDWPVPRGYKPAVDLRTWAHSVPLNLIGQDEFYGVAGAPNFDWPVPRGYAPEYALRTWIDPLKLNLIVQPFALFDWPVPRGPQHATDLLTWTRSLDQPIILPCVTTGWNNPWGPQPLTLTWIDPSNINLLTTVPGQPEANLDWPNPKGYSANITLRSWTHSTPLSLTAEVFFGVAGRSHYDWPVPRGTDYPVSLRTWIDPARVLLKDQFFGDPDQPPANLDWPNPRAAMRSIDLSTWVQQFSIQLQTIDPPPRENYDWPNPRGYIQPITLLTWADPLKLVLLGKDTFFGAPGQPPANMDWPRPRGPTPASALRTWNEALELNLLVATPGTPDLINAYTEQVGANDDRLFRTWWMGMANGNIGEAVPRAPTRDRCWQVWGTFGFGGIVVIEGSNDDDEYFVLRDVLGNPAVLTGPGIIEVVEIPHSVRPHVTMGDATTDVTVILTQRQGWR